MNNIINGPWGNKIIDVPESHKEILSDFDNVVTNMFNRNTKSQSKISSILDYSNVNYEEMISDENKEAFKEIEQAIRIQNERLIRMMIPIILGINSRQTGKIKHKDILEINVEIKKIDAMYSLIRDMLPPEKINDFKRTYCYVPIYYMYERILQESEKENE